MKIIFMGTPDFAVETMKAIHEEGHDIVLAVTQPDRPRGRHGDLQKSDVRVYAESIGVPVITPERIRKDEEAKARIRELEPEVIVVTAFGQILPKDVLDIPKYGCINVHASLLPKYRGASPIQWAVLNGDEEAGVTTMQMDEGLDTGDMLLSRSLKLDKKETGGSLFDRLAVLGGELIVETLEKVKLGELHPVKQNPDEVVTVGTFKKNSGRIDWEKPAIVIERMVRGLNPWPTAFTSLAGKTLKLWDTDVLPEDSDVSAYEPVARLGSSEVAGSKDNAGNASEAGNISEAGNVAEAGRLFSDGKHLFVTCGEGRLLINELQLEGKKRMKTEDFLRGHRF